MINFKSPLMISSEILLLGNEQTEPRKFWLTNVQKLQTQNDM